MGEDFEGNHFQFVKDINEDMENLIIEVVAEADTKVGESGLRGDVTHGFPGVCSVPAAAEPICCSSTNRAVQVHS